MGALYFLCVEANRWGAGVTVARVSRSMDVPAPTGRFGVNGVGRASLDVPAFVDMVALILRVSTSRDRVEIGVILSADWAAFSLDRTFLSSLWSAYGSNSEVLFI